MKKVIIVSIIIAALAAVFAVCAVKTDLFKPAETEKPAAEQKIEHKTLKPFKIAPIQMQRIRPIDKEKLRESIKKMKKNQSKDSDFNETKTYKKCGK